MTILQVIFLFFFSPPSQMHNADWLDSPWDGFFVEGGANLMKPPSTGMAEDNMAHILAKVSSISVEDFVPHNGIKRILKGQIWGFEPCSSACRSHDWDLGLVAGIWAL